MPGLNGIEAARAITRANPQIGVMMNFFREPPKTESASPAFPELTEREREILTLIAQGQSNAAIAERLVISAKTVSNHISNIFSKLQVADRAQVIIRAREAGMGH